MAVGGCVVSVLNHRCVRLAHTQSDSTAVTKHASLTFVVDLFPCAATSSQDVRLYLCPYCAYALYKFTFYLLTYLLTYCVGIPQTVFE